MTATDKMGSETLKWRPTFSIYCNIGEISGVVCLHVEEHNEISSYKTPDIHVHRRYKWLSEETCRELQTFLSGAIPWQTQRTAQSRTEPIASRSCVGRALPPVRRKWGVTCRDISPRFPLITLNTLINRTDTSSLCVHVATLTRGK